MSLDVFKASRADRVSKALGVSLDVSRVSLAVIVSQTVRVSWSGLIW